MPSKKKQNKLPPILIAVIILIVILVGVTVGVTAFWWFVVPRYPIMATDWLFPQKSEYRFFMVGDVGTGDENQYNVAAAMESRCEDVGADGIILLGDNFYGIGNPPWEKVVFKPYGSPCLSKLPIYAIPGNHDYYMNLKEQIKMTDKNPRWVMPHRFFNLHFGDMLKIIAIDTHVFDCCFNSKYCTKNFLKKSLTDLSSRWNIVVAHHPLITDQKQKLNRRIYNNWLRNQIEPLICNKVDAYISGHAHLLEHRTLPGCNVELFISGGGGRKLHILKEKRNPDVDFASAQLGFLEMEVEDDEIEWKFFSSENKLLYKKEIKK